MNIHNCTDLGLNNREIMREMRWKVWFWVLLIFLCFNSACNEKHDTDKNDYEYIKIGVLFPLTFGDAQVDIEDEINAIVMAAEEINSNGMLLGKKIELIIKDDEGVEEKSIEEAQNLIDEGCVAIIGEPYSSLTIAVAENVTIPANIILISPSATSKLITDLDDNNTVWRTVLSDAFQGKVAADYVNDSLKLSTAGIIYIDNSYGQGLAEEFKSNFEGKGGQVINYISYPDKSDYDHYSFESKVVDLFHDEPELIYMATYLVSGVKITNSIFSQIDISYRPQLMGCDANYSNYILPPNSPSSVVEGMIGFTPHLASEHENNKLFIQNYAKRFGDIPRDAFAAGCYDALYLLAYAILKSNSTETVDIANGLIEISSLGEEINVNEYAKAKLLVEAGNDINYNGASGDLDLDENGDVSKGAYLLWKIEDGKFVECLTIDYP